MNIQPLSGFSSFSLDKYSKLLGLRSEETVCIAKLSVRDSQFLGLQTENEKLIEIKKYIELKTFSNRLKKQSSKRGDAFRMYILFLVYWYFILDFSTDLGCL